MYLYACMTWKRSRLHIKRKKSIRKKLYVKNKQNVTKTTTARNLTITIRAVSYRTTISYAGELVASNLPTSKIIIKQKQQQTDLQTKLYHTLIKVDELWSQRSESGVTHYYPSNPQSLQQSIVVTSLIAGARSRYTVYDSSFSITCVVRVLKTVSFTTAVTFKIHNISRSHKHVL